MPKLARLLQDRNWPGSLEAIEIFRELGKEIAIPYIENECISATKQQDLDWLEHLFFACNSLNYNENDFEHKDVYRFMKKVLNHFTKIKLFKDTTSIKVPKGT
ncbi:hypothetical protein AAHH67_26905 [Niallia circulans]